MTEFLTFDTFEEMQEHLASLEQAANDRTTDDQKSMEPPCWWINPQPGIGLIIFGESWTLDEVDRRNRESYGHPLDPEEEEEADWSHRSMTDSYGRGYLFGKAFSLACPDGELGSTHRSEMIEISREQFEHARSHGWEPAAIDADRPMHGAFNVDDDRKIDGRWLRDKVEGLA